MGDIDIHVDTLYSPTVIYYFQLTAGIVLAQCDGQLIPRSEVERRVLYFEELDKVLGKEEYYDKKIKSLITICLANKPDDRPSSEDLINQLQALEKYESGAIEPDIIKRGIGVLKEAENNLEPPAVSCSG